MRILVLDVEQMGLDFAVRCVEAGHEVFWWRPEKSRDGEGFKNIKVVQDWKPYMARCKDGLILTTGNHILLPELDRYRDLGFKVFGPTKKSAELEINRVVGMKALEAAGIEVPHYEMFNDLDAAEAFARKANKPYVFKVAGDEEDKSLSYVASDPADLVGWIERKIKSGVKLKGKCMLQEKIDMLAELGVSGWMGPDGFLPDHWQACWEHKKLMAGENGPNTGEQGTVAQYVETDKLADEMLKPMEKTLKSLGHIGDFAIGAGIDTKGKAWPFEFTARAGYPIWYLQIASHRGDVAQWMRDLLDNKNTLKVSNDVSIGVVCAQPRYPYNDSPPEMVEGNPITGIAELYEDLHCVSVMMGKGPMMKDGKIVEGPIYQTSGEYVLVATALGKTVSQAMKRVYKTIDGISFPDLMFRNDIGAKLKGQLEPLQKFGYATEMRF